MTVIGLAIIAGIILVSIPILILADVFKNRVLSFVTESIALPVFCLTSIALVDFRKNKEKHKKVMIIIRIVLLALFLYFFAPSLIKQYQDYKPLIMHEYTYIEGIVHITKFGTKGFIQFTLNGEVFSVSTHMYDDILSQPNHTFNSSNTIQYTYKNDFKAKVWYLPNSKYIIDIQE